MFRKGLTAIRDEILARDPHALPGATSNHCYFCWHVLTRGLAEGVKGGGGQVGAWTGDLLQIRPLAVFTQRQVVVGRVGRVYLRVNA